MVCFFHQILHLHSFICVRYSVLSPSVEGCFFFSSAFDTKSSTSLSTATGLPTFSRLFFLADCIPLTNQPVFYASGSIFVLTFPLLVAVKLHNLDTSLSRLNFGTNVMLCFKIGKQTIEVFLKSVTGILDYKFGYYPTEL